MRYSFITVLLLGLACEVPAAHAQIPQSLQENPQEGATPRRPDPQPLEPSVQPPSTPTTQPTSAIDRPRSIEVDRLAPPQEIGFGEPEVNLRTEGQSLPAPQAEPFELDRRSDPILALASASTSPAAFRGVIATALARHPYIRESEAEVDEAEAARDEARLLQYPTIDFQLSYFNVVDRKFSNDPQNVLERSRPRERTDALLSLDLPLFDFGSSKARIASGNQRIAAAEASVEFSADRVAQSAIAAWYEVYTYRVLERLSQAFLQNQDELRDALQVRIDEGVSAQADMARYDSYRASAATQLADFQQQLAAAEAQYRAFVGEPAPAALGRAPSVAPAIMTQADALAATDDLPEVERARRLANAAGFDARAARANEAPRISVGLDAGRYGVLENPQDYDLRASVTLSHRFFGGQRQRARQAEARERRADATYERVRTEAVRDADIAWTRVQSLENATEALRDNYFASRQARDAQFQRFRYSRGTLNDVLIAQTDYFNVAARFVATISELDIARYILLSETGQLLDYLSLDPEGELNP